MKVEFLHDIRNAGTKIYEAGQVYEGDLERYVRRGDAVEMECKPLSEAVRDKKPARGKAKV